MTEQQGNKILAIVGKFCDDNDNNKINSWSSNTLINTVKQELIEIIKEDVKLAIENKKTFNSEAGNELDVLSDAV